VKAKLRELVEEFHAVFAGRSNLADSVIPPIIFLVVNPLLGFDYAVWGSLLISLLVSVFRLSRGQSLKYASKNSGQGLSLRGVDNVEVSECRRFRTQQLLGSGNWTTGYEQ